MPVDSHEMHPSRWGDPAAAAALPTPPAAWSSWPSASTTGPPSSTPSLPAPARRRRRCSTGSRALLGAEHVLTDDETRRLRTRGKSTPDLLRARAGDLADAPDAVVRPGGHDEVAAVLAFAVEHHLAVVPFGGGTSRDRRPGRPPRRVRRRAQPRPGPDEAAARRRPGLDDRDPRAGPARPRGRGAARRARADPRPLPAVVRVRLDRRLRRDPLQRPVQRRLRPLRRDGRRPDRRPRRAAGSTSAPRRPTPPAPTCASCSSAPRAPSA